MDKGILPSADTLASEFFPRLRQDGDPRKRAITMRHLLAMSSGLEWTEFGGRNSFPNMTRSADWVAFTLDQPMASEPGARWTYNSGVSQLLSAILAQCAGMSVARFAELYLFGPLEIEHYRWPTDPQGIHAGGFGLELTANDMMKFGQLYLQQGVWNGSMLIASSLVKSSTLPEIAVSAPERGSYGWHWWNDSVPTAGAAAAFYYARGFGGQFIVVWPAAEAVIVTTRKARKKGLSPITVFRERLAHLILGDRRPTLHP